MTPEILSAAAKHIFRQCIPNYETECLSWTGKWLSPNGYGRITVKQKKYLTHRVVHMARKGEIPEGKQIMHSCDNRLCVNPNHLSIGTGQDNTNDRKSKDRLGFKLKDDDVKEILSLLKRDWSQTEIAKVFGVEQSIISRIKNGKRWAHVHDATREAGFMSTSSKAVR